MIGVNGDIIGPDLIERVFEMILAHEVTVV